MKLLNSIQYTLAKPAPPRAELRSSERVSGTEYLTYKTPRRRAMTLVELLVVIFIVLTVTALAIPVIAPAMRGRQVREASRLVTAYLAGARAEALRTGRATGVIFERFPGVPEMCVNLSRCQVPHVYAGDTLTSRASGTGNNGEFTVTVSDNWGTRVQKDDLIKFNFQGRLYRIVDAKSNTKTCVPVDVTAPAFNLPAGTQVPYQVFRQPKRTSTPPVQLPAGIVIDLNFSGDDLGPFVSRNNRDPASNKPNDAFVGPMPNLPFPLPSDLTTLTTTQQQALDSLQSVMVIFAPDGSVEWIYRTVDTDNTAAQNLVWRAERPTGPIHFLLGQRARVPASLEVPILVEVGMSGVPAADQDDVRKEALARYNLFDLENLWITINPRSGQITSTENVSVPDLNDPANDTVPIANHVRAARTFALEGQAMGGL